MWTASELKVGDLIICDSYDDMFELQDKLESQRVTTRTWIKQDDDTGKEFYLEVKDTGQSSHVWNSHDYCEVK